MWATSQTVKTKPLGGKRSTCIKILQRLKKINKQTKPQKVPVLWPKVRGEAEKKISQQTGRRRLLASLACPFLFGNKPLYVCRILPRMEEHTDRGRTRGYTEILSWSAKEVQPCWVGKVLSWLGGEEVAFVERSVEGKRMLERRVSSWKTEKYIHGHPSYLELPPSST